jgi:5-dehydro-2-deoxygluconokinase
MGYDVIAMGRLGVDLYPLQTQVGLEEVSSFGKFLGGTAANVAVATARYGHDVALVSRTGDDAFGRYLVSELGRLGVDSRFVTAVPELPTPITFCEIHPPDHFPITFYRYPKAPDMEIDAAGLDLTAIAESRILWLTVSGLSDEPSRSAHHAALAARGSDGLVILDLDYRPDFWDDTDRARVEIADVLSSVDVVVGNETECEVAVGTRDPEAAAARLLEAGPDMIVVKQGPKGVFARRGDDRVSVPALQIEILNGLGAGDAFGGALCHGLLSEWELDRIIRYANAAGAIVASRLECSTAMPTPDEVESLLREVST